MMLISVIPDIHFYIVRGSVAIEGPFTVLTHTEPYGSTVLLCVQTFTYVPLLPTKSQAVSRYGCVHTYSARGRELYLSSTQVYHTETEITGTSRSASSEKFHLTQRSGLPKSPVGAERC